MPAQGTSAGQDSVTHLGKEMDELVFVPDGPKVPSAADLGITPQEPPKEFSKTITVNGEARTFKAPTLEALNDKLAEAYENAWKMNKPKPFTQPDPKPAFQRVELKPRQLTATEILQLGELQQTNPVQAFEKMSEALFGASPQLIVQQLNRAQELEERQAIDNEIRTFVGAHKTDYEDSQENGAAIANFLRASSLPMNRNNFEYAFSTLSMQGHKFVREQAPPAIPPAPEPPTFIGDSHGQRPPERRAETGLDVSKLPTNLDDLKTVIQSEMRRQAAVTRR